MQHLFSLVNKNDNSQKKEIREIRIVDKLGTIKQKINYGKGILSAQLNVSHFSSDIYSISAFDGKQWHTTKFIKQE